MPAPNPLVAATDSPPIPEAKAWLQRYDGLRGPAIDLAQAVPGGAPPAELLRRLSETAGSPEGARYGPIAGDSTLAEAYAAEVSALYGADVTPAEVAITAGCNLAFVAAMMGLARAGEAVLLPTPWYFNHQMTLAMLGIEARPLPCRAEAGFVPDPDEAERLVDDRVRALVLVTPNNPTGAVYPAPVIAAFADLCRRRGLWLVLDETYRDFMPEGLARPHEVLAAGDWRESVLQLYSFSKAYAVPGHRLGAIVAGGAVQAELAKVLDCLQICAPRTGQAALAWGIEALGPWRAENRHEINRRAEAFRQVMAQAPEWRLDSIGAYFAYLRHPMRGLPARAVAERLAVERGVLALPGPYFGPGQEEHLRVAFANVGVEALGRLGERLAGLSG